MSAAKEYNSKIDEGLKAWFQARGLQEGVLYRHLIGWDGHNITMPVFDAKGEFLCFKFRRSPWNTEGAKYWYGEGGGVYLYNVEQLERNPDIVICEGEFDCLMLEQHGIPAVTSTGGAGSFKAEWAPLFTDKKVFLCYDNDKPGLEGSMRTAKMLISVAKSVKIVALPEAVGEHGDVTDFFVKLGKDSDDFRSLLKHAWTPEIKPDPVAPKRRVGQANRGKLTADCIQAAKDVPIRELISGTPIVAGNLIKTCCEFHQEKTASFVIYPDNHFNCFGCSARGDAIDFIMLKNPGMMFVDAVKYLTNKC